MDAVLITQPEFLIPLSKAQPGMVLSRNLEHRGAVLLRHNTRLTMPHLERLQSAGVESLHIQFGDEDLSSYKRMLLEQDSPPASSDLLEMAREALLEQVAPFARPEYCARSNQIAETVAKVMRHTLDVVFGSRLCFSLLKQCRLFHIRSLSHCPTAWVYSLCIGAGLGYNMPSLLELSLAALLYDIGMLRVPAAVLTKPGKLTDQEWSQIKKHCYFGRRTLEALSSFSNIAALVAFEHHEHYYGGGYPKGKSGAAIHEFSQIVSVADKFAAMVTTKDYREHFQPYQAYELLFAQTKSAVSPRIFVAFLRSVLLYPRGAVLRLSSGELASPVDFPLHLPTRPVVTITHTRFGEEILGARRTIALAEHPEYAIEAFAIIDDSYRLHLPALM